MQKKVVYSCDYCGKTYERPSSCSAHGKHCKDNPMRQPYEYETNYDMIYVHNDWYEVGVEVVNKILPITLWKRGDHLYALLQEYEQKCFQQKIDKMLNKNQYTQSNYPKNLISFFKYLLLMKSFKEDRKEKYCDDFSYERAEKLKERIWRKLLDGRRSVKIGPISVRELDDEEIGLPNGCYGFEMEVDFLIDSIVIWKDYYL